MRALRTILGMLLLTIGLPALFAGAGLWAAMQHRDAGGAFSGPLQTITTSGHAVVVDDVDTLLRQDAPFTRLGNSRLRMTARSDGSPAFVGIAPRAAVDRYLTGVPHTVVRSVDVGTGALPVRTVRVAGTRAPSRVPGAERFWLRAGSGQVDWNPRALEDNGYSLVIMNA